jgi:hypothetical protein
MRRPSNGRPTSTTGAKTRATPPGEAGSAYRPGWPTRGCSRCP